MAMSSIKSEQTSLFTVIISLKHKFVLHLFQEKGRNRSVSLYQFVIFKPLSYCFEETIGLEVKASFARGPCRVLSNNFFLIAFLKTPWVSEYILHLILISSTYFA